MAQAHTAPFLGHMGQPQTFFHRQFAQSNQLRDVIATLLIGHLLAMAKPLNSGLDFVFHEITDLGSNGLVFRRQGEINHRSLRFRSSQPETPSGWIPSFCSMVTNNC